MFYVYEYFIVDTLEVFYVGKGTGLRRFAINGRNNYFKRIKEKYQTAVRVLDYYENELDAYQAEADRISELKCIGQARANFTSGGNGVSGLIHREDSKALMSANRKYKCMGSANPMYGGFSDAHKAKLSKSLVGVFAGEKNPMYGVRLTGEANPFYGRTHTDETKQKISQNRKGKGARFGPDNPMYGRGLKGKDNPMYGRKGALNPNSIAYNVLYPDGTEEILYAKECEKKFGIAFRRIRGTSGTIHYKTKSTKDIYEGTQLTLIKPVTTIETD